MIHRAWPISPDGTGPICVYQSLALAIGVVAPEGKQSARVDGHGSAADRVASIIV